MKILHISAECYPAAKSGGLGDVVGALPKYLNEAGVPSAVVIPRYDLKWINDQIWREVWRGAVRQHNSYLPFTVDQLADKELGFPLYAVSLPGKFDRPGIYQDSVGGNYRDEVERWLAFQQSVLTWIMNDPEADPAILHCHDHHTGLIPFMVKHCPEFSSLRNKPTIFTIHNGQYHGAFSWEKMYLLPFFEGGARGLLDWGNTINPLATGIKTCWRLTTVSPGYLDELRENSLGLEQLFWFEQHKSRGIINGIDTTVWDPRTDPRIKHHFDGKDIEDYKRRNKEVLAQRFHIDPGLPLITFIGRLVGEKGADVIPDMMGRVYHSGIKLGLVVLGTGQPELMEIFRRMSRELLTFFDTSLEYNETLAHQLYAGSDFLFMPSRVEPCGLNQMYACRYGTVPIVRSVGGLKNTIPDISEPDGSGRGIRFDHFSVEDAFRAVYRAVNLFHQEKAFASLRKKILEVDFSWENSVRQYIDMYEEVGKVVDERIRSVPKGKRKKRPAGKKK